MGRNSVQQRESRPTALKNRTLRLEPLEPRCLLAANFLGLADGTLAAYVKSLDNDGSINRSDMIGILRKVQAETDGVVNANDLGDLRKIVQNASTLKMPDYASVLAGDVVNGNAANAHYQGASLGNLVAGNSNAKLGKLTDKWFYGADLPSTGCYAYASASGSLYSAAGPSHLDEHQGALGDCYLIAGLGSIADSSQAAIKNMFIANGDGTWTVRFFYNGKADYVTVNNKLPISGNSFVFDGYGSKYFSASNTLWLPLLEKAYVQWNESGKTWRGVYTNNYSSIEGGWMGDVYTQAVGCSTIYVMDTSGSNAKTTLINSLSGHQAVTLGTVDTPNFNNTGLYGDHAYNVLSYSSSSGKFTLYNPWGSNQPKQLTWAQLSANAAGFSATVTTTSTPILSASNGSRSAPFMLYSDACITTAANTLDTPAITPQAAAALVPAAVDAALTDSDALSGDASGQTAMTFQSSNSWVSDIAESNAARSSGHAMADVDALLDSIRSHVALAL